jgi:hypothetical protein
MFAHQKLTTIYSNLILVSLAVTGSNLNADDLDPRLNEFDISNLMRIENSEQGEARRNKLIQFIWPEGLPATRPKVSKVANDCPELSSVDRSLIEHLELFDVDVSGFDFHSLVYVAYPDLPADKPVRLAIVSAGHMEDGIENALSLGLSDTVNTLLREKFVVAVVQMPQVSWNRDCDGVLPNKTAFNVATRGTRGHTDLFDALEKDLNGGVFRFFLEPVVQTVNELFAKYPDRRAGLLMTGLSGGGWTTHMAAAIDTRIDLSIPVAGSLPLYARPFSPGSHGDTEQFYAPLFKESDTNQDGVLDKADGVCSWLEIYALGALSPDNNRARQQIQVLNRYDSCCFGGPVFKTYADQLSKRVESLGAGRWKLYSDESHRGHVISPEVIEKVLLPAIKDNPIFRQ